MDDTTAKLFGLLKKEIGEDRVYHGDDLSMGSVAKYGVPTGIPELDLYLGEKGGYPAGKIIEFYGKPMCGKTTAALQAAAEWQKRGGVVTFIDTEQSYDIRRARELGCNTKEIIKVDARTIEEVFESIKSTLVTLKDTNFDKPFLFIVDSVNGVPTQADADGDLEGHAQVGFEAKQIKRGCRQINPVLDTVPCQPSIIFINHAVTQIGKMFGKQTESGGGLGIKFYSSVRLEFAPVSFVTDTKTKARTGQKIAVEIRKLKGAPVAYPKLQVTLNNADGFDKRFSLQVAMVATGFAKRPKGSSVVTVLPDTEHETQVKTTEWADWINNQEGGYDRVYLNWRNWAKTQGILNPWGNDVCLESSTSSSD
jgi:recombination protein RecA